MRILAYEFIKLFNKKLFIICMSLFFVINAFILCYNQSIDNEKTILRKNRTEYEKIINEINILSVQNAKQYLSEKASLFECAIGIASNNKSIKENLKKTNSEIYEKAKSLKYSREKSYEMMLVIQSIQEQLSYINNYSEFINDMQKRADKQIDFSIFSEKGSFSYNNILQTPKDFKLLKNIKLCIGNNIAIESTTTFSFTDFLVFAIIFLMCIFLFTVERDKGLYGLIRSTKHGRLNTISIKIILLFVLTTVICFFYYSSNFIICGFQNGFGDLSRNIQSVSLFKNCSINVTVIEYLVLWLSTKTLVMLGLAAFLSTIFIIIKNTSTIFLASISFITGEFLLSIFIDGSSELSYLKYLNFIYLLKSNNFIGKYINLNFFSKPINLIPVAVLTLLLVMILSVTSCCIIFTTTNPSSKSSIIFRIINIIYARFGRIRGSVWLFSGEWYKHYRLSFVALVIAVLVFLGIGNLTKDISIVYHKSEDIAYSKYLNTLSGEINSDKEKFINNENEYINSLHKELESITSNKKINSEVKATKTENIQAILNTKGVAFETVLEQRNYIKSTGKKYNIKPIYINKLVYRRLTENSTREWEYFTLLILVAIFASSNLFAYEHKKTAVNLIRCAKNGKLKLVIIKVIVGVLTLSFSFALIYIPFFINFSNTFGTELLNSPIVFIQNYSGINSKMTILQNIILTGIIHYIVALAVCVFTIMLSQILKNNITSMLVATSVALFPCVIFMNNEKVRLYNAFQCGTWQWIIPIIILLSIIIILVCFIITWISFSKVRLGKCNWI